MSVSSRSAECAALIAQQGSLPVTLPDTPPRNIGMYRWLNNFELAVG